jgi:hypothetical protein
MNLPVLNMRLLISTIFGVFPAFLLAQVGEVVVPEANYDIQNAPIQFGDGLPPSLIVFYSDSCVCEALGIGEQEADGMVLRQFLAGEVMFNVAKAMDEAKFTEDTLFVWSLMPYKVTSVTYPVVFENGGFRALEAVWYDPNDERIAAMEKCFEENDVECALENYGSIEYPMSYVDYREIGDRALAIAWQKAESLATHGNPKEAAATMEPWVSTFGFGVLDDFQGERPARKMEQREMLAKRALVDYLSYLRAAGDNAVCRVNCEHLATFGLEIPEPHLFMGDIHFDMGNYAAAKDHYKLYSKFMKKAGRKMEIPAQVKQRLKYKTA